ncbi:anaphase-promoting complex subunit 15-like [Pararge aegeria]|uniref:anaphase-promoting complex subunit 15-like n=1 Tax=Pararge aegeria TaxID=116150 RepID=UPI0019D197E4|nr:anaphase-promoting complex subunit 15-like [Pararge aegeria]
MNIPFPVIYPRMIDLFNLDRPCDDDAELTKLEKENEEWFNAIAKKYMRHAPFIKKPTINQPVNPEQTEETGSDDDVFIVTTNEDIDESTSQDVDDESHDLDEVTTTESAEMNNDDVLDSREDLAVRVEPVAQVEPAWPYESDHEY